VARTRRDDIAGRGGETDDKDKRTMQSIAAGKDASTKQTEDCKSAESHGGPTSGGGNLRRLGSVRNQGKKRITTNAEPGELKGLETLQRAE